MSLTLWTALALSTLVSEDLACITAGLLIQRGDLSPAAGVSSCAAGIFAGDIGLWWLGRIGGGALRSWQWIAGRLDAARAAGARLSAGVPLAIVSSRFLPGARLPLYVAAGLAGVSLGRFAGWSALAVFIWTPLLVLGSAGIGGTLAPGLARAAVFDLRHAAVALAIAFGLTAGRAAADSTRRMRLIARVSRIWRWEFWPMWLFYPPVALWIGWLALRHGGLCTMTAANPGIPDGGTLGESKADILSRLPDDAIVPFRLVDGPSTEARVRQAMKAIAGAGWTLPLILKPDVGERGSGVRLARSPRDVETYCAQSTRPFMIQPYHPGPYEAGVFYYRRPGAARGRILSITDKRFPVVVGDGRSTLKQLVWAHPRYRMQAAVFLERHANQAARVLDAGEPFRLAVAGNHSKGTMFLDGERLRTDALEQRIGEIAQCFPGFHIGRFDVRYSDETAFMAGRDLAIIELNGASAEPTDLYDPRHSLWSAYRQLFTQWSLVFEIGAANRRRGAHTTPLGRLICLARTHLAAPVMPAD